MSSKTFLKLIVAFGVVALLLIFLGVNYVPRIFASSSPQRNTVVDVNQSYILHSPYQVQNQRANTIQIRPDYLDELYPRAIVPQNNFIGSDWIERLPSTIEHRSSAPNQ